MGRQVREGSPGWSLRRPEGYRVILGLARDGRLFYSKGWADTQVRPNPDLRVFCKEDTIDLVVLVTSVSRSEGRI